MNGFWWKFYEHYRDRNHVFTELIASSPTRFQVAANGSDAELTEGEYVVGQYFQALGVQPAIGRLIEPAGRSKLTPATRRSPSSAGRTGRAAGSGRRRSSAAESSSMAWLRR